jgi:hypothetical protein
MLKRFDSNVGVLFVLYIIKVILGAGKRIRGFSILKRESPSYIKSKRCSKMFDLGHNNLVNTM